MAQAILVICLIIRMICVMHIAPEDRHRSWQIRQPAAQSQLRELRQWSGSVCFVPVMQKMQNNRDFTLSHILDRYSMSYGKKGTSSDEDVPLCGLVTDYRTFYEEYMKCVEFYNWLKENVNSI